MRNRIIKFSGGISSFAVAAWVKEQYPDSNIVLYFNDVLWEDHDLYRFIREVSDKLKLPMLIHSKGITPPQLMVMKRYMANNRAGICSQELKIKVAQEFFFKNNVPPIEQWRNKEYLKQDIHVTHDEEFFLNTTLYFGIGWEEAHRTKSIYENWQPYDVQFPLIDQIDDRKAYLEKYQIEEPLMYKQNFAHNNCAGRCVKAGQGHFQNLLARREDMFFELMELEIVISDYIRYTKQITYSKDRDYLFNDVWEFVSNGKKSSKIQHIIDTHNYHKSWIFGKDSKGRDIKKPYTFMKSLSLNELEKRAMQLDFWDLLDVGGCGCSVDYGTCRVEMSNGI